ncbi:MAG: hypothetical protein K8S98_15650 [Planctomycetes bacterium]|nr:hypothetical protein [Planctomycetota bacterium]
MWKRIVLWSLAVIAVLAAAAVYWIGPRNVVGMLLYDRRREGELKVGDAAPDVTLSRLDGSDTRLLDFQVGKPLIVIFGSYT